MYNCYMEETIMRLTGLPVRFRCYSKKTIKYLKRYLPKDTPDDTEADFTIDSRDIDLTQVSSDDLLTNPYNEYCYLIEAATDVLMAANRCFFHGVAVVWKGKAWILTAPSGTGKSTQYRNLSELYEEGVFCLNGDKPGLEICDEGVVRVYDSPWRGKEGWGTAGAAYPLAGIFFLKQAENNNIRKIMVDEAVVPIYYQFFSSRSTVTICHQLSRIEDALIRNTPIYLLENKGDLDSTRLMYQTIEKIYCEHSSSHN